MIQLILHASGSALSESEILAAIPSHKLADIKKTDPNPYFRAFVIAHEGSADPFMQQPDGSFVKKMVRVFRSAIESMSRRGPGAKYFDDYHKRTGPRSEIGQEVAFIQKEINGNLHDISIAYSKPSQREAMSQKDIVSMEADADFEPQQDGSLILKVIKSIAAYATGRSSDGALPAWSGAKAVGAIYAFTQIPERIDMTPEEVQAMIDKSRGSSSGGRQLAYPLDANGFPDPINTPYPVAEAILKSFINAKSIKVSQLFSWDALFGKKETDGQGNPIWVGGDIALREKLMEHEKALAAPLVKNLTESKKYMDEVVEYRKKDFKTELQKAAVEEAGKHKFDEKLINILNKRIERDNLSIDPAILLSDEKDRAPKLEAIRGEYLKGAIEAVRDEWSESGGKPPGETQAAGAGSSSNSKEIDY